MAYIMIEWKIAVEHMQTRAETWGHVALLTPATPLMDLAEENSEIQMLRCRYAKKIARAKVSLCGFLPSTKEIIYNPNTLQDLADIFEMDVEK